MINNTPPSQHISVIIPNYCHSMFLEQRISSVLNQTYQNFEVIIMDDCSPDNGLSKAVIEKYRDTKHVSQIIYNEKNSGSTFLQWKKGIEAAKGDWIWIAESDDFCEPNFLEKLVQNIQEGDVLAFSGTHFVNETGHVLDETETLRSKIFRFIFLNNRLVKRWKGNEFIEEHLSFGTTVCNASMAVFKKSAALAIPEDYLRYKAVGDRLFWIHISEKGNVVCYNKPLNYFRQHANKVSPKSLVDGTTAFEDARINDYVLQTQNISAVRRFIMMSSFFRRYGIFYANDSIIYSKVKLMFHGDNLFIRMFAPLSPKLMLLINRYYDAIKSIKMIIS